MKLIYLSNFFNDHQKPLADEFYKLLGDNYCFVETKEFAEDRRKLGFKEYEEPYLFKYNSTMKSTIDKMILEADVVICGEAPSVMVAARYKLGKLTFRDDESRYKHINRYLKWPIYTWHSLRWNKGYLLCASAFGCRDYHVSFMDINKCYRWGYFPEVKKYNDIDGLIANKESPIVSILWVGRIIELKHPELPVLLAKKLKESSIKFHIDIVGIGHLQKKIKQMIQELNLEDCVSLLGAMPPEEVRKRMECSQIFLFTSDRGEGWGAVLNESMNSACAVVASPVIGASPYLIKNKKNGLFFRDQNLDSLYEKVLWLINHPFDRRALGKAAYETICNVWSAKNAAKSFLSLVERLKSGQDTVFTEGPCSKAPYLKRNWFKN